MQYSQQRKTARYSWDDYVTWPDDQRWELIAGVAYDMSPAPSIKHQNVAGSFFSILRQKLSGKSCKPFIAPTDVVLSESDIVQPDVLVICDPNKITEQNIQGAPDMVVEVLSPSTALKDLREKKTLYERFGVKEYLIIDPLEVYVQRFTLTPSEGYDKGEMFGPQEIFRLNTIPDIELNLWEVFEVEAPDNNEDAVNP